MNACNNCGDEVTDRNMKVAADGEILCSDCYRALEMTDSHKLTIDLAEFAKHVARKMAAGTEDGFTNTLVDILEDEYQFETRLMQYADVRKLAERTT